MKDSLSGKNLAGREVLEISAAYPSREALWRKNVVRRRIRQCLRLRVVGVGFYSFDLVGMAFAVGGD